MKFRELNGSKLKRSEYLYSRYCADTSLNASLFIEKIKKTYYEFDSEHYELANRESFTAVYARMFKMALDSDASVVDIGAGTGDSYFLTKKTGFNFSKYYFVEPFESMINKFSDKNAPSVCIINDYFESNKLANILDKSNEQKIFLMSSVVRTLDDIDGFMGLLNNYMNHGDYLFLPVEPNNKYFGKYHRSFMSVFSLILFPERVVRKLKALIVGRSKMGGSGEDFNIKRSKHPLALTLNKLREYQVVNNNFTEEMIYAVINYNNYYCWQNIDVPVEYNEGFFTLDYICSKLDCAVVDLSTRDHLYAVRSKVVFVNGIINYMSRMLRLILPGDGATMSVILRKR